MKSPPVHFTSHACLVIDPAADANEMIDAIRAAATRTEPFPRGRACWHGGRKLKTGHHRYTTHVDEITCGRCLVAMQHVHATAIYTPRARLKMELLAHRVCCAGRGAPLLADPAGIEALRRDEAASAVEKVFGAVGLGAVSVRTFLDELEVAASAIESSDSLRSALQPALNEYSLFGDIYAELEQMHQRAQVAIREVVARVRSGELPTSAEY